MLAADDLPLEATSSPHTLARILSQLGYEVGGSVSVEQTLDWAFALEESRPFLDWLCVAFAHDGGVPAGRATCSAAPTRTPAHRAGWDVLTDVEVAAYQELRSLEDLDLAEYADSVNDCPSAFKAESASLEKSIKSQTIQLKRVKEHIKSLDAQHKTLLQSETFTASRASALAKHSAVADRTLVDFDLELSNLSIHMDAAIAEAASSAAKLHDLAISVSKQQYRDSPVYLHQCAEETATLNRVDLELDKHMIKLFDAAFPSDPRSPELTALAEPLVLDEPPDPQLPHQLAAELGRLKGLCPLTERDHHVALLRESYAKAKLNALEGALSGSESEVGEDSKPLGENPSAEISRCISNLESHWIAAAGRTITVPFLASVIDHIREDRERRNAIAEASILQVRQNLARLIHVNRTLEAEGRTLRDQGIAIQAMAEHLASARAGAAKRAGLKDASGEKKPDALAGFLARVMTPGPDPPHVQLARDAELAASAAVATLDTHRVAVRETLPRLNAETDALLALLYEHAVTADPLLLPKELLDKEHAVREVTHEVGRVLQEATRMAAAAAERR